MENNVVKHAYSRRSLLLAMAYIPLLGGCASWLTLRAPSVAYKQFSALEMKHGGRLGITVLGGRQEINYRGDERFPFCSTFKVIAAAGILKRSMQDKKLLHQRIKYTQTDLVTYSPITEKHVVDGMTVSELCAAAIQYSDNTAGNLLIKILGGPAGVTKFARSIGDDKFRLDRWETELNTAIPGDPRDTTTPASMAQNLHRLFFGDILGQPQKDLLKEWMLGNTTGDARIRAGVPEGWKVADKTGSGDYGTTNDIAVVWPPSGEPLIIAIYFTQTSKDAKYNNAVIAEVTRIITSSLTSRG